MKLATGNPARTDDVGCWRDSQRHSYTVGGCESWRRHPRITLAGVRLQSRDRRRRARRPSERGRRLVRGASPWPRLRVTLAIGASTSIEGKISVRGVAHAEPHL